MYVTQKLNSRFLLSISLVSAMGGLLFGYDWVVIGGAKPFYEPFFNIVHDPSMQGWAVSCALIGCIAGALMSGLLCDRYGRKDLLIISAVLFTISAIGTGAANSFSSFVWYRIIGGVGIGLASNISPMYIAEVTPANIRGKYVSINQLTIVIGILAAQITNYLIADVVAEGATTAEILNSWNGQSGWRWMFWAEVIPAGMFFLMAWFIPESPRFLAKADKYDKMLSVLTKIGGVSYATEASSEIRESLRNATGKVNWKTLFSPKIMAIIIIGIVIAAFQQWCGINVIFMYADEIFRAAGYSVSDMLFNIVITGSVNLIFTIVAMYTVDKLGRKALMLIGSGGLAIIYTVLGTLYYTGAQGWPLLVLVITAIACYAMTLAPVTWVVLSEIFPNKVRGSAMAIATLSLWIASTLLTYFFPIVNNILSASGSFWLFAGICIAGFFYIRFKLIETKEKSLEEIERELTE